MARLIPAIASTEAAICRTSACCHCYRESSSAVTRSTACRNGAAVLPLVRDTCVRLPLYNILYHGISSITKDPGSFAFLLIRSSRYEDMPQEQSGPGTPIHLPFKSLVLQRQLSLMGQQAAMPR